MKNQNFFSRLGFAMRGLSRVVLSESSFRFQLITAIFIVGIACLLSLTPIWWVAIILSIGMVLILETVNTAIELLCDVVQPEYSESIRDIKDMMAGAVLLASFCAVVVGVALIYNFKNEISNLF